LRSLASRGRCVVLADGWLEWREEDGKQPYWAHRPEGGLLPLAGLWDVFEDEHGARDYRFAIVTRPVREDVAWLPRCSTCSRPPRAALGGRHPPFRRADVPP